MLDQVLDLFDISPDFDLGLMQPNQSPSQVASLVLGTLDPLFEKMSPDWILVQGDTTTVMAASIAAHHRGIKVGHVEAGLRTYDRSNPFPEEMNRVVTDHISDLHFAPTASSRDNLLREGIRPDSVFITGNTVIDALQWVVRQPLPPILNKLFGDLDLERRIEPVLSGWNHSKDRLGTKSLILVTAHRRESFGEPLQSICHALRLLAERGDVRIVYLVHRNPNVWEPVQQILGNTKGVTLLPPIDYLSLVHLMKRSHFILTDSGGIQEEAPSLGVPVLVLRKTTERPEAVASGAAKLVGTDSAKIVREAEKLLEDPARHAKMARAINPYGDGKAAQRIVDVLMHGRCEEFIPESVVMSGERS